MSDAITYAKVNGPPDNWRQLRVYDGEEKLEFCLEVNTVEGWARCHYRDSVGKWVREGDGLAVERLLSDRLSIRVRE